MSLQPGTSFGPYEIVAQLGAGGMGEVYRARDTRLNREVAIKTLPESFAADPERVARFRREAETLAALNHPNIATIYGLEQIDGVFALAMELVEGPTLADRLGYVASGFSRTSSEPPAAEGPPKGGRHVPTGLPLDEALPLAKQLTLALEAAHERGIIHRDLKPANIKVTADGSIKLLDFGLAKALDAGAGGPSGADRPAGFTASPTISVMATQAGMLLGTAAYMSPEQVRGTLVDKRADIWAYGVVLFEMLTGGKMFGGETISDTLAGVLREPIHLERLPADTPGAIRRLLARCLERDPKRRLRDIGEARIAIENYLADPSAAERTVTAPAVPVRPTWLTAAPWALVTILLAALAWVGLRVRSLPPPREIATLQLDLGDLTPQRGGNSGGFVAVSPDGRRIVIAARHATDERGQQRLYQRTLDRREFSAVPGTEDSSNLSVSPDGQWVVFQSQGQLKKVSFGGGVPIPICDVPGANVGGTTWADNDTIVFAAQRQLFQVSAGGGRPSPITASRSDDAGYVWPSAIPGRHAVLATVRSGGPRPSFRIVAMDLDGKDEHAIAADASAPKFANGFVVFAQQAKDDTLSPFPGRLLAAPFDVARLAVTGPPIGTVEDALVFSGGAPNYDLASNGTLVLFSRAIVNATRNLAWLTPTKDGSTDTVETLKGPAATVLSGVTVARLSRDDRVVLMRIGFSGAGTLYTYSIDRGAVARVPFDGDVSAPIFGPGTDEYVTFGSQGGVWVATLDGSKPAVPLTAPQPKTHVPGSWSSDGTTLVLTELTAGTGDIAMLRRGDKQATPLVATPADERLPVLSPDDRWVAYTSNESGRYEVYVRPFRGPGGRYTVSAGGGEMPLWSKDGRRLFYVRENANLMAVDVKETPAFAATAPRLVATSSDLIVRTVGPRGRNPRPFDVARDGRLLVIHSTASDSREQVAYLVLNFDQDIRRRLAPSKP